MSIKLIHFIDENAFEKVVCQKAAILSRNQCFDTLYVVEAS